MDEEVIKLWPEGVPSPLGDMPPEADFTGPSGTSIGTAMKRNISDPTLTVFLPEPDKRNGRGVIICPGGGWRIVAWQHEGVDVARWFAARGYTAFVLRYRVMATPADEAEFLAVISRMSSTLAAPLPAAKAPRSIRELTNNDPVQVAARAAGAEDGRRAVELVRARAGDWKLKPEAIGMIGFSAGAFLVTDVALEPRAAPLAFLAAIYGGEVGGRTVPADAPPLFTTIAHDDRRLFRVVEGLYTDWSNADRPAALHVFSRGGHGFGMVRQGAPTDRWIDLLGDWLDDLER